MKLRTVFAAIFVWSAIAVVVFLAAIGVKSFLGHLIESNDASLDSSSSVSTVETETSAKAPAKREPMFEFELVLNSEMMLNEGTGNKWDVCFRYKGREIESGLRFPIGKTPFASDDDDESSNKIYISVCITEEDETPEYGTLFLSLPAFDGCSDSGTITVIENQGVNKGKTAIWSVSARVRLVENAADSPTETE